jgi:hypothetical protein
LISIGQDTKSHDNINEEKYHIKRHDIFERYFTCPVTLHKSFVYNLGAAAGGKTQYERAILSGFESLDTTYRVVEK